MANTEYRTVLSYVKAVLSSIDSDEVASCGDTTESRDITDIVRRCYEVLNTTELPEHFTLFKLLDNADAGTDPTVLLRPTGQGSTDLDVSSVIWIRYDCKLSTDTQTKYELIDWLPWEQFIDQQDHLSMSNSNVGEATYASLHSGQSFTFRYTNNARPRHWSSPDDVTIIFDSYDIAVDTTGLQASKTKCWGRLNTLWRRDLVLTDSSDAATMDAIALRLDPESQIILENEAIALAWAEKKQLQNVSAERVAKRANIRNKKQKNALNEQRLPMDDFPNFGRRGRGMNGGPTWTKAQKSGQ